VKDNIKYINNINQSDWCEGQALVGERLDAALTRISGRTRSFIEKCVRDGFAYIDGISATRPGQRLREGQLASVMIPPPRQLELLPEEMRLTIVYEDDDIAAVDKPAGLVVHPSCGHEHGTLVNGLLAQLGGLSGIGGAARPGIVHRLDKDTSGLLLIAKNDRAHVRLSEMLALHTVRKTYLAAIQGAFAEPSGRIDAPVGRHQTDRKKMAVTQNGKPSTTLWRLREPLKGASLLEVDLITGRTHQIRVHMSANGHPILGDTIYGLGAKTASRLMLHSWKVSLLHPITEEPLSLEVQLPSAFEKIINGLKLSL
jgi:23S rRNA pseudouridine1911/1915/1917 synthase